MSALPSLTLDWTLFSSTFGLIFLAELPDKTAFATLLLATDNPPLAVFTGAAGAFLVQTLVAVAFGRLFAYLPAHLVHVAAGVLFLVFAVLMWRRVADEETEAAEAAAAKGPRPAFGRAVASSFLVIFAAEWGDLTQLATATLVAKYDAWLVIGLAAVLALWSVTAIGVVVGSHLRRIIPPLTLQRAAAVALAGVGIYLLAAG